MVLQASPTVRGAKRPALSTWLFLCAMGAIVAAVLTCTLLIDRFVRDEAHQQATKLLELGLVEPRRQAAVEVDHGAP